MRKAALVWTLTLLALAASPPAQAQAPSSELVISAGADGGYYARVARRLRTLLTNDHHVDVRVEPSNGSIENLERLDDPAGPVGAAFAQADALHHYLADHPDFAQRFVVLADLGRECAHVVVRREGGPAHLRDLGEAARTVSVGSTEGGAAVTWANLVRLAPQLGEAGLLHVDALEALARLKVGGPHAGVDAVLVMQRPRIVSPALEIVLDTPDAFTLLPVRAGDLPSATLPDGGSVYSFERTALRDLSVETVCTRGLLVVSNRKVGDELRGLIARVVLEQPDYVTPPPVGQP